MNRSHWAWALLAAAPAVVCAAPAWAATSTSIVVTSNGETLPRSSIQLFNAETGAQVRMEEEDDDRVAALFLLDGGRYRVVVNGETVREISVSGTGSQRFTIDVPPRLAGPAAPPEGLTPADERRVADAMRFEDEIFAEWDEKTRHLVVHAGVGELDAPTGAGTGFQRPSGGVETFAGRNADTIRMHTLGLVLFPLAYREWLLSGSVLHGEGDERSEGRVPDGTNIDTGFVYSDFSPGGSTGVNIGDRGLDWITSTEAETLNLKIKAVHALSGPVSWFLFADYLNSRRQYDSAAMAEVFGETLTQMRSQKVTDDLIGGGAGLQVDQRMGGVQIGGWTSAGLFHRSSDLRASEHNVCPLCGPQDADFTLNFDDSDDGVTWAAAVGVYLAIPVTPNVAIGVGADAAYIDEVGAVFNPSSGDQVYVDGLSTRLTTTDALSYNFRVGLRVAF